LALVVERQTPLEICLTSNRRTETIESHELHPGAEYARRAHPLALCTDDCGVFETTLSDEYRLAARAWQLDVADVRRLSLSAVNSSFADQSIKTELIRRIDLWFDKNDSKNLH
jgi:adenosine deaminase